MALIGMPGAFDIFRLIFMKPSHLNEKFPRDMHEPYQ